MPTAGTMHRRAAPITLSAHSSTSSVSRSSLRRSLVHETARRDAPPPATTAVFVCISPMYIMCMCHDSRRSGLHFQPWALFFFRPSFHLVRATAYSVPLVLRELQPRQLPHLVCWLPTRELLINSRPLLLLLLHQLLHSFFPFFPCVVRVPLPFHFYLCADIMDILAWIGTRYQAVVENCVLSYIFLYIYARALWYLRIFN